MRNFQWFQAQVLMSNVIKLMTFDLLSKLVRWGL